MTISAPETILFILLIGFGVSIVSLEIHARRQARDLAALQAEFRELQNMKAWALNVNTVLTRQCMINDEVQKRIFKNEEAAE